MLACVNTCALSVLSAADVKRARTATPGPDYVAPNVHSMGHVLNGHLRRMSLSFSDCSDFDEATLRARQHRLAELVDPELVAIYPAYDKRRPRRLAEATDPESHLSRESNDHLQTVRRDGLCHEVVLAFVHHLNETARARILLEDERFPLLPTTHHARALTDATRTSAAVFDAYESQLSCQVCHTGPTTSRWANTTLPPPLIDTTEQLLQAAAVGTKTPPLWGGARRWASFAINMTSLEVSTSAKPWLLNYYYDAGVNASLWRHLEGHRDWVCSRGSPSLTTAGVPCDVLHATDGWLYINFPQRGRCCRCTNDPSVGLVKNDWLRHPETRYMGTEQVNGVQADHFLLQANFTSSDNHYYCTQDGEARPVRFMEHEDGSKKMWDFNLAAYVPGDGFPSELLAPPAAGTCDEACEVLAKPGGYPGCTYTPKQPR